MKAVRTILKQNILTIATLGGVIGGIVGEPKEKSRVRIWREEEM